MNNAALLPINSSEFFPLVCPRATLPLIEDDELVGLLEKAAQTELDGLVQTLIKKGGLTCQLKGLKSYEYNYPNHRLYVRDIAAEIQKYGANTLTSHAFRSGKGVKYEEIVRDVAAKLKLPTRKTTQEIEASIQVTLLDRFWRDLSPDQRRALLDEFEIRDYSLVAKPAAPAILIEAVKISGFAAYKLSVIFANAAAHALLGHGLSFVANAALTKGLAVLTGPVGWGFVAFLTANSIAGEAYRVTVPCVLQVSMIRLAVAERERPVRRMRRMIRPFLIGAFVTLVALLFALALWVVSK